MCVTHSESRPCVEGRPLCILPRLRPPREAPSAPPPTTFWAPPRDERGVLASALTWKCAEPPHQVLESPKETPTTTPVGATPTTKCHPPCLPFPFAGRDSAPHRPLAFPFAAGLTPPHRVQKRRQPPPPVGAGLLIGWGAHRMGISGRRVRRDPVELPEGPAGSRSSALSPRHLYRHTKSWSPKRRQPPPPVEALLAAQVLHDLSGCQ